MNTASQILRDKIKSLLTSCQYTRLNAIEAYDRYWGTSANTDISALGNSDPVTVSSKLIKSEFVSGITLSENLKKFWNNEAFSAAAYINSCRTLILGDNARTSVLTQEVESIGALLATLSNDCIEINKQITQILAFYSASELSAALGAMSSSTVMFGTNVTKSQIIAGLTALEQFQKFLTNASAAQGDYKITLALWEGL